MADRHERDDREKNQGRKPGSEHWPPDESNPNLPNTGDAHQKPISGESTDAAGGSPRATGTAGLRESSVATGSTRGGVNANDLGGGAGGVGGSDVREGMPRDPWAEGRPGAQDPGGAGDLTGGSSGRLDSGRDDELARDAGKRKEPKDS